MKKLDIHRDMPEPSLEDMQKHMNFEEVLNRASVKPATPQKGFSKGWLLGGTAAITAIVATVLFTTQFNPSKATYKNVAMEGEHIEKIEVLSEENLPETLVHTVESQDTKTNSSSDTEDSNEPITSDVESPKVEYLKPKLVSSIPFVFDESFKLREQWQNFEELSIYENLSFQPIDKTQQSVLKLTWDKVDFKKDENGQYYFILYKGDQGVICPVTPVFEKENYLDALGAYQEHQ